MNELINMGGYGEYVWSAYAVFLIIISIDFIYPFFLKRKVQKEVNQYYLRQKKRAEKVPN